MATDKVRRIGRREFLKKSAHSAAYLSAISAFPLFESCTTAPQIKEDKPVQPVHYPRLPGQKIQSPEHYGLEGCMTGCWCAWTSPNQAIPMWSKLTGKAPSVLILPYRNSTVSKGEYFSLPPEIKKVMYMHTITEDMIMAAEQSVIPFVTYEISKSINHRSKDTIKHVIDGKLDKAIIGAAKALRQYGEQYGGFFIRTMREMNLSHWPWGGNAKKYKKAHIHIWDIFDGAGTNEFATWVWNPYVGQRKHQNTSNYYYPGDKYVDWIGLNGYNADGIGGWIFPNKVDTVNCKLFNFCFSYSEGHKYCNVECLLCRL